MVKKLVDDSQGQYSQAFGSFIKLYRATWTITARVAACLPGNLTFAQFTVLEALYSLGPMYQRELVQRILRTSASVTSVVDTLESRGMVERTRSRDDRRLVLVSLTPAGEELIEIAIPIYLEQLKEEFSVLDADEQKLLGDMCRKLGLREQR